jgi:DUF971 family protein
MPAPVPTGITLHQRSRVLELAYADGTTLRLPYELLRVRSPSAEVRGHGPGQGTVQTGQREVDIVDLEPVGHYALRPTFSDGHATGLYTWDFLWDLGTRLDAHWQLYFDELAAAGLDRDAPMAAPAKGCGSH